MRRVVRGPGLPVQAVSACATAPAAIGGIVRIDLDLQAALPAIDEYGQMAQRRRSIATGTLFFCPNGLMPPT